MLPVAFLAAWAAYAVGSWGYCLVKGYDVSFREWVSPLSPYSGKWPPPLIPEGKLWPYRPGSQAQANTMAAGENPVNPGGVA